MTECTGLLLLEGPLPTAEKDCSSPLRKAKLPWAVSIRTSTLMVCPELLLVGVWGAVVGGISWWNLSDTDGIDVWGAFWCLLVCCLCMAGAC